MDNEKKIEYVYFREGVIQSVISDIFMFGLILGGFFANAFYFEGKWYIYLFFMLMGLLTAFARTKDNYHRFTSKQKLRDYINSDLER